MDMTELVCGGCNRAWDTLHERLRPGCPYLSECEKTTLLQASCAHCTGTELPKGLVDEDDFRDYRTQAERLSEREDWWQEVQESLDGQGVKLTLGHKRGYGVRSFAADAFDLYGERED